MLNNRVFITIFFKVLFMCLLLSCHSLRPTQSGFPKHMKLPHGGNVPPPPPLYLTTMDSNDTVMSFHVDARPDVPGSAKYHGRRSAKYHGRPIPDTDGDGVNDEEDKCPNNPGPRSNHGCPVIMVKDRKPVGTGKIMGSLSASRKDRAKGQPAPPATEATQIPNAGDGINGSIGNGAMNPVTKKSAALSISFPYVMKQQETRDLRVFMSIKFPEAQIKAQMEKIQRSEMAFSDIKSKDTIITRIIELYKNVSVKIMYDPKDLEITPIKGNEKQLVDSINGNYWYWHVKAISDKPAVLVTVSINAERFAGDSDDLTVTNIPIKIGIDNITGLRKAWNWVISNPGYSIPSILVPFILFLFKRRKAPPAKTG